VSHVERKATNGLSALELVWWVAFGLCAYALVELWGCGGDVVAGCAVVEGRLVCGAGVPVGGSPVSAATPTPAMGHAASWRALSLREPVTGDVERGVEVDSATVVGDRNDATAGAAHVGGDDIEAVAGLGDGDAGAVVGVGGDRGRDGRPGRRGRLVFGLGVLEVLEACEVRG